MLALRLIPFLLVTTAFAPTRGASASPVAIENAEPSKRPSLGLAVGPALLLKSRSNAVPHLMKPLVSLHIRWPWRNRLEVGAAAVAMADNNEHYRVLGVLVQARWQAWASGRFSTGLGAGLGGGYDADILRSDLRGEGLAFYARASVDMRWHLGPRWVVGAELDSINAATARLAALVARRF